MIEEWCLQAGEERKYRQDCSVRGCTKLGAIVAYVFLPDKPYKIYIVPMCDGHARHANDRELVSGARPQLCPCTREAELAEAFSDLQVSSRPEIKQAEGLQAPLLPLA